MKPSIIRIIGLLNVIFIASFSLDALSSPKPIVGLLVSLIPAFVLIIILVISQRSHLVGFVSLLLYSLYILALSGFRYPEVALPTIFLAITHLLKIKDNST